MLIKQEREEPVEQKPLYGVNLGGWLVVEKWMTPSLFAGTDAVDEYTLCQKADDLAERLQKHRDTFITQSDFLWLQLHGIRAVRLPVGYWVFGGEDPYVSAIEYVDKAFAWAEETGIHVLLDLHGAPGSQNGHDHSGRSGAVGWHKDRANIIKTLEVAIKLVKRYKNRESFLGIELLNEPKSTVPRGRLLEYYEAAYRAIRAECGNDLWIVFSDGFRPQRWKRKLKRPAFKNMYIDRHEYQTFDKRDKRLDILGHLQKTLIKVPKRLDKMARHHPVIIGEWSIVLDPKSFVGLNELEQAAARTAYGNAQLIAYDDTAAWFYWSYKTETGGPWSYRDSVENGWLPDLGAQFRG